MAGFLERGGRQKFACRLPEFMLLEKIVKNKEEQLARDQKQISLEMLMGKISGLEPPLPFKQALAESRECSIIAEIKRASPVKGDLGPGFDPIKLARAYRRGGASAISVITEENYFKGSRAFIKPVKQMTGLPVLCKDFIINQYQVYEARANGADALLLILGILDKHLLKSLLDLTRSLDMEALVEAHDRQELEVALEAGAGMVGINNRDLKTFRVDLSTTLELAGLVPDNILVVGESGIRSREDIELMQEAGVNAVLVGETLIRAGNPAVKLKSLLNRRG